MAALAAVAMGGPARGSTPSDWPAEREKVSRQALDATATVLVRVHLTNTLEMALGRLAQARGQRPEVRRLGQLLVADVARADRTLARYSRQKCDLGMEALTGVIDHTGVLRRHVDEVSGSIEALSGPAFDAHFLGFVSTLDGEVLDLVAEGWRMVPDPRLRAELGRIGALIDQHRQIARALGGG
jgi:hypothetical protein